ncbi:MAG: thioredoxin family protein [Kiritimatiellia bacterium]|jgi:protein disulfide-isomerase
MHKKMIGLALVGILSAGAVMASEGWLTDFEKAKQKAEELKRPILADFTGSDWCVWCIRLDKEVFTQKEFKDFAKDNLVLFMADFPRNKQQYKSEKKQNEALREKYGVSGYPTIFLLKADGEVIAKTGYKKGGAAAYVQHLQELLKQQASGEN